MNIIESISSNSKKKCIIVFSGFNQRAIIAFLRTLEKNNLDYAIIAKSQEDDIFLTTYKNKVFSIRESVPLVLEDLLSTIKEVHLKKRADEYMIAPTTEALNRFLLNYREEFEGKGYKIPLVDKELYELVSNKYSFGQLCLENQISIPMEINLNSKLSFPIVAKPKEYYSSVADEILSPIIINGEDELSLFENKYNTEDFYFQEFIDGKSLYLLYYFSKDGNIYKFSQENLIQQPEGKSMLMATSSQFHNSFESDKYEELFKSIKFWGLVMVEIKQKGNINYMIEANPRFWGPSQLFVDAGINLFEVFLYDYGLIENAPETKHIKDKVIYFWFGGIKGYLNNFEKVVFHNYSLTLLLNEFASIFENDIYLREDSNGIFAKEVFKKGRNE